MDPKYGELSIDLIKEALRGYAVARDDSPDGKYTYAEYLAKGFYLNTPDQPSDFIPRISPLQLLLYVHKKTRWAPNSVDGQCAKAILSLFHLEPNFTWQQYGQFHAYWEVLYRILFSGEPNNTRTIAELYQRQWAEGDIDQKKKQEEKSFLNLSPFNLSGKHLKLLEWPSDFPQTLPPKPKQPTDEPKLTPEELENADREMLEQIELVEHPFSKDDLSQNVIMPSVGNPGFDIVCFEVNQTNVLEPIVICVECRFSDPEATTLLTKAEIQQKRHLTLRQFRSYCRKGASLCGFTLKEENLVLVICAFRSINKNAREDLPANTIVLDRQQLEALYSPSLATRPQFIISELERKRPVRI